MEDLLVILLVEDEDLIQRVVEDALKDGGFAVKVAASGERALALLDAPDTPFRALVTDINLGPGKITGWDVAKHARELQSDLPVVYMTGDSANEWASKGVPNSILLTKPFAPAQVLTAVSQLLNTAGKPE